MPTTDTSRGRGAARRLTAWGSGAIAGSVLALGLTPAAFAAPIAPAAAVAELVSEQFDAAQVSGAWTKPTLPGATGNLACLTAGSDASTTPIPGCGTPADATGAGTLRLTGATEGSGSVFAGTTLPTANGLRVTFDSYQYAETALAGDGLALILAAVDPTAPQPPSSGGPGGGSLGYSPHPDGEGGHTPGVPYGYLGVGLDVFGGFASDGGRDCAAHDPDGNSVTVRGPGNGTAGYCLAGEPAGVAGGLSTNSATRPLAAPVEFAINPTAAQVVTETELVVPAHSWAAMVVGPSGTGEATVTSGALPTRESLTALGFPASWIDETTGLPKSLALGFAAGSGSAVDNHEVAHVRATSLVAPTPAPQLSLTAAASDAGTWKAGGQGTLTLSPSVATGGGEATDPVTVKATVPQGVSLPATLTVDGYDCAVQGQTLSCTTSADEVRPAGTALPQIVVPVTVADDARGTATIVSTVASPGATTVTTETPLTFVAKPAITATVTPVSVREGGTATLSVAGLAENATGTLTFTVGDATLCTATLPATSCEATVSLPVGEHTVSAAYSGDAANQPTTATATLTVTAKPVEQPQPVCPKDVVLTAGKSLTSAPTTVGGRPYTLVMQDDGNAVIYAPDGKATWQSGTSGNPGARLVMQADGTFVVYSAKDAVLFAQITGKACSTLALQGDGNLVIYSPESKPLWFTGWDNEGFLTPSPTARDAIAAGQSLHTGEELTTESGYRLVMQGDGNLVLYSPKNTPVWASYSTGDHLWATLQKGDGNFVVYARTNGAARPVWTSGVTGAATVQLQDGGTLVQKSADSKVLWTAK